MSEPKLSTAFHKRVATQTVLIRRFYTDEEGRDLECHGTGVIIGHETISKFRGVHIATAGHVLDGFGGGKSVWQVSRIEMDKEGNCSELQSTFRDAGTWTSFPRMMVSKYLNDCDIGLIAIENKVDGDELKQFIDPESYPPLKLANNNCFLHPGAKVAWAGYPSFVADITGSFELCYFEGQVSCVPSTVPIYFVDGHTARGVSGGPLWAVQNDGEPLIFGVCIHYHPDDDLPGLVGFCPLSALLAYVERFYAGEANE